MSTFHEIIRSTGAMSHVYDMQYYRSMAQSRTASIAELMRDIEQEARAGRTTEAMQATLAMYKEDRDNYVSNAELYRLKAVAVINKRWGHLPMHRVGHDRHLVAYGNHDLLRHRRAQVKDWGVAMGNALRNEDQDDLVDLLNNIDGSGHPMAHTVVDKLNNRWEDVTSGNKAWKCPCCDTFYGDSEDSNSVVRYGAHADEAYCSDCTNSRASWSDVMGAYIDDSIRVAYYNDFEDFESEDQNDWVTTDWVYMQRSRHYNVISHPNSGDTVVVNREVYNEYQQEYNTDDSGLWADYHQGERVGFIPTTYEKRKHRVYCGVECEFDWAEDEGEETQTDRKNRAKAARALIDSGLVGERGRAGTYGTLERDGSLNFGFEFISGYTGLDVHAEQMPKVLAAAREGRPMFEPSTTGIHVHVSRAGMTPYHAAKLMHLIYRRDNRSWIQAVAGRSFGTYNCAVEYRDQIYSMYKRAKRAKKGGSEFEYLDPYDRANWVTNGVLQDDVSRYAALSFKTNSTSAQTVEFRMFQGTTETYKVLAYIEFAFACWHFSQQESYSRMTPENFAKFICRPDNRGDTKNLRVLMQQVDAHTRTIEATYVKPRKGDVNKKELRAAKKVAA